MGPLCSSPFGRALLLPLLFFLLLIVVSSVVHGVSSSSPGEARPAGCRRGVISCMRCDSSNTSRCAKCSQLVVFRAGCGRRSPRPHDGHCPPGYTTSDHWTSFVDYMASVCKERLGWGWGWGWSGVSGEAVGATVGVAVCALAALATFFYCRLNYNRRPPPSLTHSSQGSGGYESDWNSAEFVKEVGELRAEGALFLAMLNDTRRQVRALTSHSALQPYKPVLKDLSRILILVNRPNERLGQPPPDWETLSAWAHRVLNRYKKQQRNNNPNQVNELVNFLSGGSRDSRQISSALFDSNFNSKKTPPTDYDAKELDYNDYDYDDDDNNRHRHHHHQHRNTGVYQPNQHQHQPRRINHFFTLGFRPQDEITTEL